MTTAQQLALDILYASPMIAHIYGNLFPYTDYTDTKLQWITGHVNAATTDINDTNKVVRDCAESMTEEVKGLAKNWIYNNVTA